MNKYERIVPWGRRWPHTQVPFIQVELKVLTWAEGKDSEVFKGEADESVQDKLKSCCGNS